MFQTDANKSAIKSMRAKEKAEHDEALKAKCKVYANQKFGEEELNKLSNTHKGLWFLPILDDDDEITAIGILKPIDRNIMNYASTKVNDEGLFTFLEVILRSCWVAGDDEIKEDEETFIAAANALNKIVENKKAALVKR